MADYLLLAIEVMGPWFMIAAGIYGIIRCLLSKE